MKGPWERRKQPQNLRDEWKQTKADEAKGDKERQKPRAADRATKADRQLRQAKGETGKKADTLTNQGERIWVARTQAGNLWGKMKSWNRKCKATMICTTTHAKKKDWTLYSTHDFSNLVDSTSYRCQNLQLNLDLAGAVPYHRSTAVVCNLSFHRLSHH